MTQHDRIRDYLLEHKNITSMEAFQALGITKLATRIGEMRRHKGYVICSADDIALNRYGDVVRFEVYWFPEEEKKRLLSERGLCGVN